MKLVPGYVFLFYFIGISLWSECSGESTNRYQVYEKYTPMPYDDGDYEETTETDATENGQEYDSPTEQPDQAVDLQEAIRKTEAEIKKFNSFLPEGYRASDPPLQNETVVVESSIIVFNIRDINEFSRDLNLEINLRVYWVDDRLEHLQAQDETKYVVLNSKQLKDIWTPDVFIDRVKNVDQPMLVSQSSSLRIYYGSIVRWSARLNVKLSCAMDFSFFPADTQVCPVELRSFKYPHDQVHLVWRKEARYRPRLINNFNLSSYDVRLPVSGIKESIDMNEGGSQHSVIGFEIHIRRKMYYHMLQTYFPSILFIIISWLSFLVPPANVSARMTLCMSTLLNLSYMFAAVRQNTPNDSYAKALDVWMIGCIFFVFLTLVEYAFVLKLNSMKVKRKPKKSSIETSFLGNLKMNINFERLKFSELTEPSTITPISYSSWYYIDPKEYVPYQIRRPKLRNNSTRTSSLIESSSNPSSESSPSPVPPMATTAQVEPTNPNNQVVSSPPVQDDYNNGKDDDKYKNIAKFLEFWAWRVIPLSFIAFNLLYWPIVLLGSGYYSNTFR